MATAHALLTGEEFDRLTVDDDRRLELIDGEMVEVPVAVPRHNNTQANLLDSARPFVRLNGLGGVLPTTRFMIGDVRYEPDLAVVLGAKWDSFDPDRVPVPFAPDIAAEIASRHDSVFRFQIRIRNYLRAGVREVWAIHTETREVFVHTSDDDVRRLGERDSLMSPLLPGWSLPLADLFAW